MRPFFKVLGVFAQGFVIGLPVVITFSDNVGSVKGVSGISMQPTLNPNPKQSDLVVVNCWTVRHFDGINRGDIVTLVDPTDPNGILIKRVIGLEGDRVKTMKYKHKVVKVPQGHCWVEGDNTRHSMDSNAFGPVPLGLVRGKATHIVWPPARWRKLENHSTQDRLAVNPPYRSSTKSENIRDTMLSLEETEQQDTVSKTWRSQASVLDQDAVTDLIYGPVC